MALASLAGAERIECTDTSLRTIERTALSSLARRAARTALSHTATKPPHRPKMLNDLTAALIWAGFEAGGHKESQAKKFTAAELNCDPKTVAKNKDSPVAVLKNELLKMQVTPDDKHKIRSKKGKKS
jgi:hypothetical protein